MPHFKLEGNFGTLNVVRISHSPGEALLPGEEPDRGRCYVRRRKWRGMIAVVAERVTTATSSAQAIFAKKT
jgi:hypothetical protein